ncbi:MAG: DUF4296 domain-containing protein [Bacteroidales bacterium]|nr:DUF4296 domain-containing protein [Bacteroidales bacterium]
MKRIWLIFIPLIVFLVTGCGKKDKQEAPADLIPKAEMIDIITEAWFMEGYLRNTLTDYETSFSTSNMLYDNLFEKYGINKEQFVHSVDYYLNDDHDVQQFLEECSRRLEDRQEEFTGVADPISQPQ